MEDLGLSEAENCTEDHRGKQQREPSNGGEKKSRRLCYEASQDSILSWLATMPDGVRIYDRKSCKDEPAGLTDRATCLTNTGAVDEDSRAFRRVRRGLRVRNSGRPGGFVHDLQEEWAL